MTISVFSVDGQFILATASLMSSVMAVMNLATLHRTGLTRFLNHKHHTTMADCVQDIDTPKIGGTHHTPIMFPDIGNITSDHSPAPFIL